MIERTDPKRRLPTERRLLIAQEGLRDVERTQLLKQLAPVASDAILDVGCSTGKLMQRLQIEYGVGDVWGVDPDPVVANPVAYIVTASATNLDGFPDGRFTKLVFSHALEHIADRPAALAEANRVLQDNGELHIAIFLHNDETYHLPGVRAATPDMPPYLTRPDITSLILQSGFVIEHEEVLEQTSSNQDKAAVPTLLIKARKNSPNNHPIE